VNPPRFSGLTAGALVTALLLSTGCRAREVERRELALRQDLRILREVISQFRADTGDYPPGLEALVEKGLLRGIPLDPITRRNDTWIPVRDPTLAGSVGIIDVRSGAAGFARDGSAYAEW
jgi:general secretion pathway protein G